MNDLDLTDARAHQPFDELAASFVLHQLEPAEQELFAMHLDECSRCRRTVAELTDTLGEIALDIPSIEPPPELGQRIRAAARAYDSAKNGRPTTARPRASRRVSGKRPPNRRDGSRASSLRKMPWLLTAAAVLTALVLGGWNVVLQNEQSGNAQATAQQQNAIRELAAAGGHTAALSTSDGRQIAYVVPAKNGLSVVTDGVAANQVGQTTYWLWALRGTGKPVPVGSFDVSDKAIALHHVNLIAAGPASSATAFAVSVEKGQQVPVAPSTVVASGSVR